MGFRHSIMEKYEKLEKIGEGKLAFKTMYELRMTGTLNGIMYNYDVDQVRMVLYIKLKIRNPEKLQL